MTAVSHALIPLMIPFYALFGLVIGSFLNVVIARVPAGASIVSPGSTCPKCLTAIKARDNVPVLSWLLLRGKCRSCAEPISSRYPLVEAATGVLFAVMTTLSLFHTPALTPLLLFLSAVGVALFMIDIDYKRLPDAIVLPSYPVVIGLLVLAGVLSGQWPVLRVVSSGVVWLLVFGVPWLVTTGRGMGFGDVKLAPLVGLTLGAVGWGASLVGLFAGFVLGAVVGVALLLAASGQRKIPYGPYMLAGALVGLAVGQQAFDLYRSVMGLA